MNISPLSSLDAGQLIRLMLWKQLKRLVRIVVDMHNSTLANEYSVMLIMYIAHWVATNLYEHGFVIGWS
jgi:hypothetical protein